MAIPSTQRLLRTLLQRASTIFTGPRSSQRWRTYTSTPQQPKPKPSSTSQQHTHEHTHHQQHTRQHQHHIPKHETSMWSNITFRALVAHTTTSRPAKPQVVTTIRCYSKRIEESPHSSSSPSPTTSPHSRRRWSPLLGLIPMTFVSSQNDEDDKMLQGSGPTSTSGSPSMTSMTSMTSSPSQRWRGRTGSSPLDFVRMRLRDMTDDEDISPQTSPILPIRGYDKTHTWHRHGKVGTLQFELEDEDEMTPPSTNLTPTTPPVGTPSTSYFASRVDSDGRLVIRSTDVLTIQAWHQLASFLSSSSHVTSLRLQGMVLSAAHVTLLGNDVLRHIHNLTFVDNNLGITDTLQPLINILKSYPQLESLSLIRQSLTDDHLIYILPIMTTHAMTHVSLAWNGIGDEGAKRLSLVLRQAQSICKMDLSYNVIGPRGSDALSLIQQQVHRLGRTLSINLKQNYRHSETPPIKHDEKLGWGMLKTSMHTSTSSMGMGSVTASEMLGVMASDITTSVIPRSQPIAIPTPSQSSSSFERHFLSGMSFH